MKKILGSLIKNVGGYKTSGRYNNDGHTNNNNDEMNGTVNDALLASPTKVKYLFLSLKKLTFIYNRNGLHC